MSTTGPDSNELSTSEMIQFLGPRRNDDIAFDFYYAGGKVSTLVYDEAQFKYKQFMPKPVRIDHSRSVLSPMPGSVVEMQVK